MKQRHHIHDFRLQPVPIHTFYTVRKLRREKKINQREKKKDIWNEGEMALRIQYVWQKKYPLEPENCHRVAVISVSNSFQLWITRPISRAPCTQHPFTVTRQSSNSENKDHMSSNLWNSSLPVYATLARTARSLMLLHQLSILGEAADFLFLVSEHTSPLILVWNLNVVILREFCRAWEPRDLFGNTKVIALKVYLFTSIKLLLPLGVGSQILYLSGQKPSRRHCVGPVVVAWMS